MCKYESWAVHELASLVDAEITKKLRRVRDSVKREVVMCDVLIPQTGVFG